MKFLSLFLISFISIVCSFSSAQSRSSSSAAAGTSVVLYDKTISIGNSKAVVNFDLGESSSGKKKKWYNAFDLNEEEKVREKFDKNINVENRKWKQKELFTAKGLTKSYLGQSFLFLFWLGASQVYHCYNDYSQNPMACYQFLLSESSGIHRAGLMAFVVASGFVSTSPGLYNLGFKMFKRNRLTESFMSASSLTMGVTAQSVLMQFMQYYLQDEDNNKCSKKFIIQQELAERRRWGNKVNYDEAIEQDPCRLAADKNTVEYMKSHLPPEIASLWATMPILFALQTSLGMAVSPSGVGLVSGLQKLTEHLGGTKGSGVAGARLDFQITMQKVSQKLGSFYKMTFNLKKNSKVFQLAEYLLKPGSWWHSGLNLLAFIGISEAIAPTITEAWFKKVSSSFDESNETFLRTMVDMGSAESRNFLVQPGCNNENALTCEPPASLFLSRLRKDFSHWREIRMQTFVATYQGWQQKIQELMSGFNASLRFYNEVALSIFKIKIVAPPWKKQTTLGGIYTLVPDNVNDERDLFLSPAEYYGPMSERAFLIGLGIKAYLTFYAKESKLPYQFLFPKMNKEEKFKSLVKEFEFNFKTLKETPEIKDAFNTLKDSGSSSIQDFEVLFKKALGVLQQSHHNDTIKKFESYRGNTNYLQWLARLDQIANKIMSGFLLNTKIYGLDHLRPQATSVKKYVQMSENKDYAHPIFLDEQKEAQLSLDTPMKIFGTDPELVRVIEIIGKLYYTTILRDSDYMYYISRDQYCEVQAGINELMDVVGFVNKKDQIEKLTSVVVGTFPKLVQWGWISKDSLSGLYTFDRKLKDFFFQIPETFAAKIYNFTPIEEITRITNTIYSGLGAPFAPQNEAQAYKERYMRYTVEGRNQNLYSLPKKTNQILTKTIFDSMIVGMICGPERPDGIFKVSHATWNNANDVDFKDFFPDQFKPFRIVDSKNPKVKAFCSKTIGDQETLNKYLPEAFAILQSELGSLRLPKLSQELVSPEYGAILISLYCNITEWDRGAKKHGKIKKWKINPKTWYKYEAFCKSQDGHETQENQSENKPSISWSEINALINETSDLINSLSKSNRDTVIKEHIKVMNDGDDKLDELEVEEMYRSIKSMALAQTLAIRGTLVLEKILQNYQLLYNAKLPVLEEVLLGAGADSKSVREMVKNNYRSLKELTFSDVLDHGKEVVSPRVVPLTENKFQDTMAMAILQESSYYLAFLSKFYTYYFNENVRFENKNADLMMQMSPFMENYNKNASIFETVLTQVGAVDTKYYLPRAPVFIWTLNNSVTEILQAIINKKDEVSKEKLVELNKFVDYLDIFVLKVKLAEDNYTPEQLEKLQSTYSAEGAKELNIQASERAVLRTWLVHYRNFIFDLMSLSTMIQPINLENASAQNYKN